jgi:hypothetical protein
MLMQFRMPRLLVVLALLTLLAIPALAQSAREHTQFSHDIVIGPDEQSGEVVCFGCSVRIRGHVNSDVTTFGGGITIEDNGEIAGGVTAFGGNVRLNGPVKVNGDLTVFGGRIHRDSSASVGGDVTNFAGGIWIFLIFVLPLLFLGAFIALIIWLVRTLIRPRVAATA